jgi:hypothetical protein
MSNFLIGNISKSIYDYLLLVESDKVVKVSCISRSKFVGDCSQKRLSR